MSITPSRAGRDGMLPSPISGTPTRCPSQFLESVSAVSAKLKAPVTADRKFEDVVKSAQGAAVLVLVY